MSIKSQLLIIPILLLLFVGYLSTFVDGEAPQWVRYARYEGASESMPPERKHRRRRKNYRRQEIIKNGLPGARILPLGVIFHGELEFHIEKG